MPGGGLPGNVYYLFFTDPGCLENNAGRSSNVYRLLHGDFQPHISQNQNRTTYNYRAYKLRSRNADAEENERLPIGRIILGKTPGLIPELKVYCDYGHHVPNRAAGGYLPGEWELIGHP